MSCILFPGGTGWSQGSVHGHARFEKVKGRADLGYVEIYEYKAFLCRDGSTSNNYVYHCGDPGTASHPNTGCFWFPTVQPGTYSLMTSFGKFYPRGKVTSSLTVVNGMTTERNSDEPIDYSGYYSKSTWDGSGGNPVFQTFVATGTSIARASFAKADSTSGGDIQFSIRESNGGAVETWPQVGPTRSVGRGGYGGDHWVAWQAGEVPTVPGRTYALRLYATNGVNIQPYWCSDGYYPNGTGYRNTQSNPAGHDYYMVVFADNDDTIATIQIRSTGLDNLAGWWDAWAQSYTARGTSLAGGALFGTVGAWSFTATCSVHRTTPNGPQVGPTKVIPSVYGVSTAGVAGVCFSQGEGPTTPGETYWLVYQVTGGFNPWRMNEGNAYSGGTASYYSGSWQIQAFDLYMDLYEYATGSPVPTPTATATPVPGSNILANWGFEQSAGDTHPSWTNNSDFGTNGLYPNPGGAQEGTQWAGYSYGGGDSSDQELYQTVPVVPGHTYYLSAYSNLGGTGGTATAKLMWANGAYPGKGNGVVVDTESWVHPGGIIPWTPMSGLVTPTASTLTFILRVEISGWGAGVNWDNCSLVDQTGPGDTPTNTPTVTATVPGYTPQTGADGPVWQMYR